MAYSFSDTEDVLANMHGIAPEKRSAFANRLKNFQRKGFPRGLNTGRGVAATYEIQHVFLLAFALELVSFGFTPERAVNVINESERAIAEGVLHALESNESIVCYFRPSGLMDLQNPDRFDGHPHLYFPLASQMSDSLIELSEAPSAAAKFAFFSLSATLRICTFLARGKEPNESPDTNQAELRAWAQSIAGRGGDRSKNDGTVNSAPTQKDAAESAGPTLFERMANLSKDSGGDVANDQVPREEVKRGNS